MGPRLHGSARTTAAVRRAIQQSQERLATLAQRDALHPTTVAQWKKRPHVHDAPMGPTPPRSTVLTLEEDAQSVAFRTPTLWPLDDGLSAVHATLPHVTRSARHRGLQRHGLSRLPEVTGENPAQKKFTSSPLGSCHRDIAEGRTAQGQLSLFGAIDRAGTCADAEVQAEANHMGAAQFRRHLGAAVPSKIHTVLTANGIPCTHRQRDHSTFHHLFARVWQASGLAQRLIHTNHPWTHGQAERMNRPRNEAPVQTSHDQPHHHLTEHLPAFLMA